MRHQSLDSVLAREWNKMEFYKTDTESKWINNTQKKVFVDISIFNRNVKCNLSARTSL